MADSMNEDETLVNRHGAMKRYQLTSLQIRDMVSYVHHSLWVIVDHDQERLVFLVDYGPPNRKWSKSFEVWQRFVSQSRRSPFVNHQELKKVRRRRSSSDLPVGLKRQGSSPLFNRSKRFFKPLLRATSGLFPPVKRGPFYWLGGVVPAVRERWQVHGLYGCLAFEVRLADVVGINYLNQLQSDGIMALEVSEVQKREFGDFQEALAWYSRGLEDESDGKESSPPHKLLALERSPSRFFFRNRSSLQKRMGQRVRQSVEESSIEKVTLNGDHMIPRQVSTEDWSTPSTSGKGFAQGETSVPPRKASPIAIPSRIQPCHPEANENSIISPGFYSAQASPEPFVGFTGSALDRSVEDSLGDQHTPVKLQSYSCPVSGVSNSLARVAHSAEALTVRKGSDQERYATNSLEKTLGQGVKRSSELAEVSLSSGDKPLVDSARCSPASGREDMTPMGETDECQYPDGLASEAKDFSDGKRPYRKQRSMSLDDPELKAVLDRVVERAAQIASYKDNHLDSEPQIGRKSRKRSRTESQLTGNDNFVNLPQLRSVRQTSLPFPSESKSPTKLSVPVTEVYTDRLVMFRFRDPLLPEALKEALCTDQRLLKMLESGLPTWAIFVQSYPALCHVYHPWMRRISGFLYFFISAITVLIGFYDLYKNLPFVQEFLHRLFGPLYDWVEQWQMGARLGYLGTMLFLQNFQKAFRAAQGLFRSLQYLGSVAFRPVAVPLWMAADFVCPFWQGLGGLAWEAAVLIQGVGAGVLAGFWYATVYVVSPVVACAQAVSSAGFQLLYPLGTAFFSALLLPVTLFSSFFSGLAPLCFSVGESLQMGFGSISSAAQMVTRVPARQAVSAAKAASSEGLFRELWLTVYAVWIDLLWKVFGAVRRIVFGFLAFIFEINKHRLSTYNHVIDSLLDLESALWQCFIDAEEIMQKTSARVKRAFAFSLRTQEASKSRDEFLDAQDFFDDNM